MKPYAEQLQAVSACIREHRGIVVMPTGFGKSITMALVIRAFQVRTLIVVPNLGLKHQLQETFKALFGSTDNITIENIDSPRLETASDYDLLIIDEAQHVAAATYRRLNKKVWNKIYYRFFFSATPFRNRDEEQILFESVASEVIYRVSYARAVEIGAIVPVEAYYIELPTIPVRATTWAGVYKELVTDREDRNAAIVDLMERLHYDGIAFLTLTKEVKHGQTLQDASGPIIDYIHGECTDNRIKILEYNLGEIKGLIATTGVCGEGIDIKPAEYVVIAGLGKSKPAFMQNVGRVVRRFPGKESGKVIIIKDASHKWTLSHFNAQVKILRDEYGVEAVRLGEKPASA